MHRVRLCLRGKKRTGQGTRGGGKRRKRRKEEEERGEEGAMGKRSGKKWSRQTTV